MSLTEKLKTRRETGMIQHWFRAGDKTYVVSIPDPNSNYFPKRSNILIDIRDPVELRIAQLVYDALYSH